MSIVSMVIKCDWPGCEDSIVVPSGVIAYLDDHDWEGKYWVDYQPRYHACPVHRFKTSREFYETVVGEVEDE